MQDTGHRHTEMQLLGKSLSHLKIAAMHEYTALCCVPKAQGTRKTESDAKH